MILDSPLFKEALEFVDDCLAAQRRSVPILRTEAHTALILTEQHWVRLKEWIEQVAQTGKFAQIELERKRTLRQRAEGLTNRWRSRR